MADTGMVYRLRPRFQISWPAAPKDLRAIFLMAA